MKVGTFIDQGWLDAIPEATRHAEEMGYDFVCCDESSHDSMLKMTLAASASQRVKLLTAITVAFPRSPMVLAMEAWDIQHLSRGRFILGLGTSSKQHNERRFGVAWTPPAPRMKEYVRCLHAIWETFQHSRKPDFVGKTYRFQYIEGYNPGPIPYPRPRVFLGVVGDAMARVAGEVADGIPYTFLPDRYMREVILPNVKIGLERAGRTWEDIEIIGPGAVIFGENESEIEQRLGRVRSRIVAGFGATASYRKIFELHGWGDLGERLYALSLEGGKWEEMRRVIPEAVLRDFVQTSTGDNLPDFIRQHREYTKGIVIGLPARTPAERERLQHLIKEIQKVQTPGVPAGLGSP